MMDESGSMGTDEEIIVSQSCLDCRFCVLSEEPYPTMPNPWETQIVARCDLVRDPFRKAQGTRKRARCKSLRQSNKPCWAFSSKQDDSQQKASRQREVALLNARQDIHERRVEDLKNALEKHSLQCPGQQIEKLCQRLRAAIRNSRDDYAKGMDIYAGSDDIADRLAHRWSMGACTGHDFLLNWLKNGLLIRLWDGIMEENQEE